MQKWKVVLAIMVLFFVAAPLPAIAQTATSSVSIDLSWDSDPTVIEPDLQDYRIYWRLGYEGDWTKHSEEIRLDRANIPMRQTFSEPIEIPQGYEGDICFYVTAVDTSGNESDPSESSCVRYDRTPPAAPVGLQVTIPIVEVPPQN